jgi:release factor glutamine methyltransferase
VAHKTIKSIYKQAVERLLQAGIEPGEARLEAELIIEHVTGLKRAQQLLNEDTPILGYPVKAIEKIVAKREKRVPLQYLLGETMFMGFKFEVGPGVLIPRPDTETLVARAVALIKDRPDPVVIMDVGSGSGCISVALLKLCPNLSVYAVDVSPEAAKYTRRNAELNDVQDRLTIITADWLCAHVPEPLTGIVSNPPYVPEASRKELMPEVATFEPSQAVFGLDDDGLGFFRNLSKRAPGRLKAGGFIVVEVGFGQSEKVAEIFRLDSWKEIEIDSDLSQIPRVLSAFRAV